MSVFRMAKRMTYKAQVSKLMLFPNLAYSWTFNCSISSRTVLSFPSTTDMESSILLLDEASISCASESGSDMKVFPILYLYVVLVWLGLQGLDSQPTGSCRLHPLAPTRSTTPQDPPCPSTAFISNADADQQQGCTMMEVIQLSSSAHLPGSFHAGVTC